MYKIVETKDNSPSLILGSDTLSEMMHNSHGAFQESLYIYESALVQAQQLNLPLKVYSLGLGLGYNEWISMGFALKHNLYLQIQTSESEEWLYRALNQLLEFDKSPPGKDSDLMRAMNQVVEIVAKHYSLDRDDLKTFAYNQIQNNQWQHFGALSSDSLKELQACHVIFYDAFSKKMSPSLWSEAFLNDFIHHMTLTPGCIFTTYACTGALKRALKNMGFQLLPRKGFEGKRESTLAVKSFS